ncbi:hypothetical protein [Nguyenibacter vanlangensis]|uniref:hypothetical protein n=1 Tax=Nguyenibacter vanlangensis TaxID=1216886 RepID=UPI001FE7551A|nr:hypothetical protein [Nguyenibacter vanlangensis]
MKITVEVDLEAVGRAIADHALVDEREGVDAMSLMLRGAGFAISLGRAGGPELEHAAIVIASLAKAASDRAMEIVQSMALPDQVLDLLEGRRTP